MPPLFMKTVTLTLLEAGGTGAGAEFNCNVKAATVEASPGDTVTYQTLCPDGTYSQPGATTYDLHLVGVQDWDAPGLARFLDDNEGVACAFVVQAHGAGVAPSVDKPAKTGTCILVAPSYGGEVDNWAEFDVTLPIMGKPTTATAPVVLVAPATLGVNGQAAEAETKRAKAGAAA
jgi:hypothetical protein